MRQEKTVKSMTQLLLDLRTFSEHSSHTRSDVTHLRSQLASSRCLTSCVSQTYRAQPKFAQHTLLLHWNGVVFLQPSIWQALIGLDSVLPLIELVLTWKLMEAFLSIGGGDCKSPPASISLTTESD